MPNWCNNTITIQGSTDTIKRVWDLAHSGENGAYTGLLDAMVPMPKILENTTSPTPEDLDEVQRETMLAQTGHDNWYDWCVSNWGTKWDISNEGLEYTDRGDGTAEITGWFDSAWAPPIAAYEAFADMMDGVDIAASYYEPGMDFAGFWSTENGDEFLEDLHGEYNLPEDERSELYNRLDEELNLSEQFAEWDELEEF